MIRFLKNTALLFLLFSVFSCTGCKDEELDVLAEIPFRVEFEIPAGINVFEDHFFPFNNLLNNYENILDQLEVDPARVERIDPVSARMSVQFANNSLAFIREASIYLDSSILGRRSEAFWTPEVPFNTGDLLIVPGTLINAKDFFEEQRINLEVRLDTREVPSSFITVRLDVVFAAVGK